MLTRIETASVQEFGEPVLLSPVTQNGFSGGFVMKTEEPVEGSTSIPGGHVIAFGSRCPHMGCNVNRVDGERLVTLPCPCHGSTFDLKKGGLVVLGPATQNLPQLRLEISDDGEFIIAADWLNEKDPTQERWPCEP